MMDLMIQVISRPDLVGRIFSNLTRSDLQECSLVCKTWELAVQRFQKTCYCTIDTRIVNQITNNNTSVHDYLNNNYKSGIHKLTIIGWTKHDGHIEQNFYQQLFNKKLTARKLILKGRGIWETCLCSKNSKTTNGTLIDDVKEDQKTNLEIIMIGESFTISSCALIDLISRSPKLKILGFFGRIRKHDHIKSFNCKVIHSKLEKIYWPFPTKKQSVTLNFIVKRNDKLNTLHSSMETICDLLSGEYLPRLKHLSINLNEDWTCAKGEHKKAHIHLERTKYLALGKNVESLEVRTFDLGDVCEEDEETGQAVANIFENYKLSFWEQISRLTKLKYLAVFGAWDLESISAALAKHCPGIQYFKTNCLPSAVSEIIDEGLDKPLILAMTEAMKNIRKVTSLRSLHYQCADKLANIDAKTIGALKELIDIIWIFDIKTPFKPEVEEFLNALIKRGNQSGKLYHIDLHVIPRQAKDVTYADILLDRPLKIPASSSVKSYINSQAEASLKSRYGQGSFDAVSIWGIRLADMPRDRENYEQIRRAWKYYEDLFNAMSHGC